MESSSQAFRKLRSRLKLLSDHLELVDGALLNVEAQASKASDQDISLVRTLGLPISRERNLRLKTADHRTITNHSRSRNAENTIRLLYTEFSSYLRLLLREMYNTKPLEILNKAPGDIKYYEIVRLGSYEAICDYMVDRVFRRLESQRSTKKMLDKILEHTGVVIENEVLRSALMYLELRHLHVHSQGVIDEQFIDSYGDLHGARAGRKISSSIGLARKAIRAVHKLCQEIDQGLSQAGYFDS